jgi:uncharacterized protein YdiU (UPF0061 family)
MTSTISKLPWVNHFSTLGESFYSPVSATPLTQPYWVHFNPSVAQTLGLSVDAMQKDNSLAIFQRCAAE